MQGEGGGASTLMQHAFMCGPNDVVKQHINIEAIPGHCSHLHRCVGTVCWGHSKCGAYVHTMVKHFSMLRNACTYVRTCIHWEAMRASQGTVHFGKRLKKHCFLL